jgi:type IV pilus assembly protein PilY1
MKMTTRNWLAAFIISCVILGPTASRADDTQIYAVSNTASKPNVLIIFDNNAGMGSTVSAGDSYVPGTTYAGAYTSNVVYKLVTTNQVTSYVSMNLTLSQVTCTVAHDTLATYGTWTAPAGSGLKNGGTCGNGGSNVVYLGNLLNYNSSPGNGNGQTEVDAVKDVVTNVVGAARETVNFGLMVFGSDINGGRIMVPVEDLTSTTSQGVTNYNDFIAKLPPATPLLVGNGRPLAEALYDAGVYYHGDYASNTLTITTQNGSYGSPVTASCQKNFVIIITNGDSDNDSSPKLTTIGDFDGNGLEPGAYGTGTHYLDDVAKYLYEQTLIASDQHIITHTVLVFSPQKDLLEETADSNHGRGSYHLASDANSLSSALTDVITSIVLEADTSYVAPVVPVSPENRTYSGNYAYIGFFQPQPTALWNGNLKKYGIYQGQLVGNQDASHICDPSTGTNCVAATDSSGKFDGSVYSYWTTLGPDGGFVVEGGTGEVLESMTLSPTANYDMSNSNVRKIYTYFGTNSQLNNTVNQFVTVNPSVTPSALGLASSDTTGRDKLVKFIHGMDAYDQYNATSDPPGIPGTTDTRPWILGDVLHSGPVVVSYDNGLMSGHTARSAIYVGANDGMLHAFDDATGKELWAYIPNDLLTLLHTLSGTSHHYFVDGSPKVYLLDNNGNGVIEGTDSNGQHDKVIIIFGERRGGVTYHALDVTDPDDPRFLWDITRGDSNLTELGQTWSSPEITKIAITVSGSTVVKNVFFVGGGYDPTGEDVSPAVADVEGRAIYAIDVETGNRVWSYSVSDNAAMTAAFPSDVTLIDDNRDGFADRLYIGDVKGRMWRFDISSLDVSEWSGEILFSSNPGADASGDRKILYPPDVTREADYYYLFFGTGDRAHPLETSTVDRIYAVKDDGVSTSLIESDLVDVTADALQLDATDSATISTILANLESHSGWYIRLDQNAGEKVVAQAVVFNKVVSIPTFTPQPVADRDPCVPNPGTGRVYEVNYLTGEAVFNYDTTNDSQSTSNNTRASGGDGSFVLRRSDRVKTVGLGIPSQVVIIIPQGGTGACDVMALAGIGGGVAGVEANCGGTTRRIYWQELL